MLAYDTVLPGWYLAIICWNSWATGTLDEYG